MVILFRSFRSVRCAVTFAILFFLGGCTIGILKLSGYDDSKDGNILGHKAAKDDGKGQGLLMQLLKDHINKEPMHAMDNMTNNGMQFLKNIKGKINKTVAAANKFKAKYKVGKKSAAPVSTKAKGDLPNYNVHVFYYPWYGNPEHDGKYLHWNHEQLPHWNTEVAKKWPQGQYVPPDDIGSNFYPELGCYSSRDPVVIDNHMQQLREAGVGVVVYSWYPPGKSDEQGYPSDDIVPQLLDTAHKYQLKVAFHSEPYKERTEQTFIQDVKYLINTYGSHPAFYRRPHKGSELPLIYIYDSYLIKAKNWAKVMRGNNSIRRSRFDAIFIGLLVEQKDKQEISRAGFDGFYTYFASNAFTYGSKWQNWKVLAKNAYADGLMFIPSVGPGYIDVKIRPWNGANTRTRNKGRYYSLAFESAIQTEPHIISITSFNEWHEGTQIERAVPKRSGNFTYEDYTPYESDYYLRLTRQYTDTFQRTGKIWSAG
ncbi:glycoprotein endo-alpha-1,2-mannosidase-like [Amphiura filiformis]|uniref:glycoprotein endo-alpha-1,2-mannosidase-like n=1 Tax=Amphiura filiformis TaxID=82378 RepID=UPI003B219184